MASKIYPSGATKIVTLWANDGVVPAGKLQAGKRLEVHGGENNGGARRCLCPRSEKYVEICPQMSGVRARGTFYSGNPEDINLTGTVFMDVDYVTGMPNFRWEHIHVLDTEGWDYLLLFSAGEIIDYEGLVISDGAASNGNLTYFADEVSIAAHGLPVVDSGLDYAAIPAALWVNANTPITDPSPAGIGPADATRPRPWLSSPTSISGFAAYTEPAVWFMGTALDVMGYGHHYTTADSLSNMQTADLEAAVGYWAYRAAGIPPVGSRGTVARGMWQRGAVRKDSGGVSYSRFTRGGDHWAWVAQVGWPQSRLQGSSSSGYTNAVSGSFMRITGLQRIFLAIFVGASSWGTDANTPNGLSYLASTPVAPAVAPREHVRGRIWAKLGKL